MYDVRSQLADRTYLYDNLNHQNEAKKFRLFRWGWTEIMRTEMETGGTNAERLFFMMIRGTL
jgi:hypothetical protein